MEEKGRTITKSYTKAESEQLYYDVMAVRITLCMHDIPTFSFEDDEL